MRRDGALGHMRQLDGLRAFAVLSVLYSHWMPRELELHIPWGQLGVELFFVLSGFLITGILLRCRDQLAAGEGVARTIARFWARRSLRIFPLYFAALAGTSLLAPVLVADAGPWMWTYTLNLYRTLHPEWTGPVSHLWSLSVEEQFYLVWPLLVLLAPRRWLVPLLVAVVALGPASRLTIALAGGEARAVRMFTLSCLDTLGAGGLLALLAHRVGLERLADSRLLRGGLWIGLPLGAVAIALRALGEGALEQSVLLGVASALVFGWVVVRGARGMEGGVGALLAWTPVAYLGRISYGIYLLHKPAPLLLERAGIPFHDLPPVARLATGLVLAVSLASLSWHLFEAPINGLKRRVPYRPAPAVRWRVNLRPEPAWAAALTPPGADLA